MIEGLEPVYLTKYSLTFSFILVKFRCKIENRKATKLCIIYLSNYNSDSLVNGFDQKNYWKA